MSDRSDKREGTWADLRGPLIKLATFAAIVSAGLLFTPHLPIDLSVERIESYATRLGPQGPLYLFLCGLITPLLFLPRWPIALLAGTLYGVWKGALLATMASGLGAWLHFELSLRLIGPFSDTLRKRYRLERFVIPPDRHFTAILLMRAFPLSSFVATNMIAGALRISRLRFLLASLLGMIPSSFLYAAGGKALKDPSIEFILLAAAVFTAMVIGTWKAERMFHRWRSRDS